MRDNRYHDPRIAATVSQDGDTEDDRLLAVEILRTPVQMTVPRAITGAPEYISTAQAEAEAERLRPMLTQQLARSWGTDSAPYQRDENLVMQLRVAAITVVTSAAAGLEAFANWHIEARWPKDDDGKELEAVTFDRYTVNLDACRDLALNERYCHVLPVLLGRPRPTVGGMARTWQVFRRIQSLAGLARHGIYEEREKKGLEGKRTLSERLYGGRVPRRHGDDAGPFPPLPARLGQP